MSQLSPSKQNKNNKEKTYLGWDTIFPKTVSAKVAYTYLEVKYLEAKCIIFFITYTYYITVLIYYYILQCLVQSFQLRMESLLIYQITRNSLYFTSTSNVRHRPSCWKSKQRKKWSLPSRLWLNWDRNGLRISIKRVGTINYHLLLCKCPFVRFSRKTILMALLGILRYANDFLILVSWTAVRG